MAGKDVKVSAAKTNSPDPDEDVGRARLREGYVAQFEPADINEHAGPHCFVRRHTLVSQCSRRLRARPPSSIARWLAQPKSETRGACSLRRAPLPRRRRLA